MQEWWRGAITAARGDLTTGYTLQRYMGDTFCDQAANTTFSVLNLRNLGGANGSRSPLLPAPEENLHGLPHGWRRGVKGRANAV